MREVIWAVEERAWVRKGGSRSLQVAAGRAVIAAVVASAGNVYAVIVATTSRMLSVMMHCASRSSRRIVAAGMCLRLLLQ